MEASREQRRVARRSIWSTYAPLRLYRVSMVVGLVVGTLVGIALSLEALLGAAGLGASLAAIATEIWWRRTHPPGEAGP